MSTTTKTRPRMDPPKVGGGIHICPDDAAADSNDPFEKVTALCGAEAHLFLNGDILPMGFDFYLLGAGHESATCLECRKAVGLSAP